MKALRYLLIVMSLVSVLSVTAQSTAQLPESEMKSTSAMVSSGSSLPQAATTGAVLAGETPYSSAAFHGGGPRKIGGNNSGGSGDREDPYETPIGDAVWPLLALACAYCAFLIIRTRKRSV